MNPKRNALNAKKVDPLFAGTGRKLTEAESQEKMRKMGWPVSTPAHRKAERHAQKVDKHYEMSDSPLKTKGYRAYHEALKKKK